MRRNLLRASLAAIVVAASLVLGGVAQAAPEETQGDGPSVMIVGGTEATSLHGEASIQGPDGWHYCGGNLITPQWVLTAAHCAPILVPGVTQIRVGSLDRTAGGELVGISQVVVNPAYTGGERFTGDHALVKLDRRVRARTVPLALSPGTVGTKTRITGWGRPCQTPDVPECNEGTVRLQQLATVLVAPKRCDLGLASDGTTVFMRRTDLCMAAADGTAKMACHGDSGGPMLRNIFGRWYLVATTSGDGDDLYPHQDDCSTGPDGETPGVGVYQKVGPSFRWIVSTISQSDGPAARELASATLR